MTQLISEFSGKISVVAPAYNEQATLSQVLEEWLLFFRNASFKDGYEIIICNDGSRDQTGQILDQLAQRFPQLKPIHHVINQGAAVALRTAIQSSTGDWVLLMDADGQFPIQNLVRIVESSMRESSTRESSMREPRIRTPSLVFTGVRSKKDDSFFARFGSWASGQICNLIYSTHYRDFNCALKLVEGQFIRSIVLEAKGLNYSTEMSAKILERGVSMVEVEIEHRPRLGGKSSRQAIRDAFHRALFVFYLGIREFLFFLNILQRPSVLSRNDSGSPGILNLKKARKNS